MTYYIRHDSVIMTCKNYLCKCKKGRTELAICLLARKKFCCQHLHQTWHLTIRRFAFIMQRRWTRNVRQTVYVCILLKNGQFK